MKRSPATISSAASPRASAARSRAAPKGAARANAEIAVRLEAARRHCEARGTVLTPLRRRVLELLLMRGGAAKAYDLQAELRGGEMRNTGPMTVYRALEFLMENELVHRIDALNSFMVCNHEPGGHQHQPTLLICEVCEETSELADDAVPGAVQRHLKKIEAGFRQTHIEIKGVCGDCGRKESEGRHRHV